MGVLWCGAHGVPLVSGTTGLHAAQWEALEQAVVAMFGYITELPSVEMTHMLEVTAEAEDLEGLLFHLLDSVLKLLD